MNFFEKELRKIVGKRFPGATYTGLVCRVLLTPTLRGEVRFMGLETPSGYDCIAMTVIDREKGPVDRMRVSLSALIEPKTVRGRAQKPTIVYAGDQSRWAYGCKPNARDYARLTNAVCNYLDEFTEQTQTEDQQQTQTADQQWSQTMQ